MTTLLKQLYQPAALPPDDAAMAHLQSPAVAQPWPFEGKTGHRLTPSTTAEVAGLLYLANTQGSVLAMSEAEAGDLPNPVWLDLGAMKLIHKYVPEDGIITVETGITMGELAEVLEKNHQCFAISYPPEKPLGQVLVEDAPGLETGFSGYPRDHVLGIEVVGADGTVTHTGGEVMKNVTGYDMIKLTCGSHNSLGVITKAILKLSPLPAKQITWTAEYSDLTEALAAATLLRQNALPITRLEVFHRERLREAKVPMAPCPWYLMVEVSGSRESILQANSRVESALSSGGSVQQVHATRRRLLGQWLTSTTDKTGPLLGIRIAAPLGQLNATYEAVVNRFGGAQMPHCQFRPAAGLLELSWTQTMIASPTLLTESLASLQTELSSHQAFLKVACAPDGLSDLAKALNLPLDPGVRQLNLALKQALDPKGILYSRYLDLSGGLTT